MVTLVNRAKMSTSTTGTGTVTLGSAVAGYQSFANSGVSDGATVRYVIEEGNNWEIGSGVFDSTSGTMTRTASESSNAGSAINLSGAATLFLTAVAEDLGGMSATNPVITSGTITEDVYTISGTSVALEPDNGSIQVHTLTANTTYTDAFSAGQAITLMIDDGTDRTITWPTMTWVNNSGSAPALAETGYTVVSVWKIGSTLYGAVVDGTSTGGDSTGVHYFDAIQEGHLTLTGNTPTINAEAAGSFDFTATTNTTFTFSGVTTGNTVGFVLKVNASGTNTLTWPSGVNWAGGTAPDAPASGERDVYVFMTLDGGTNWYAARAIDAA